MMLSPRTLSHVVAILSLVVLAASTARSEEEAADRAISLADGRFTLTAPESWKKEKPRSRIIEHEFSVPAAEGDELPGRMTIMAAGGSVDDNIKRWYGQFKQADGSSTADAAKTEKKEIAGIEVHIVDISGTFMDRPSPMAEGVERENYRMLGAILVGDKIGQQFIKFYAPAKTVEENEKAFSEMIESLQAK